MSEFKMSYLDIQVGQVWSHVIVNVKKCENFSFYSTPELALSGYIGIKDSDTGKEIYIRHNGMVVKDITTDISEAIILEKVETGNM